MDLNIRESKRFSPHLKALLEESTEAIQKSSSPIGGTTLSI